VKNLIFFYQVLIAFRKKLLKIIFFEIFYSIINVGNGTGRFKEPDIHPTPYYFSYKIAKFINKEKIKSVAELGCGFGRITNFIGKKTNAQIYGYEIDKEAFLVAKQNKSKGTIIKNKNILKIDYSELKKIECFIIADPFYNLTKKNLILQKNLINRIDRSKKNIKKKYYIITVNINESRNFMFSSKKILKIVSAGDKRKIKIYSN